MIIIMKDNTTLISEVMEKVPNKYMAVIVASKRARAINDGQRPLVKTGTSKSTTAALMEIAAGVVTPGVEPLEIEAPEEEDALDSETEEEEEEETKQLMPPSDSTETDEEDEKDEEEEKE
jgi:DNA-directed RNA polymerase omega subunit